MSDTEHNDTIEISTEENIESKSKSTISFHDYIVTFEDKFSEFINKFEEFKEEEDNLQKMMKEYNSKRKTFYKEISHIIKNVNNFTSKLEKIHNKDNKTKRKNKHSEKTGKSGFNKPAPVPKQLSKYIGLDDDIEMTRPQLLKMLNAKFQEDGFKDKSITTITSSKAAKRLGVEKGYVISSKQYHTFIASYFHKQKAEETLVDI
jgi:predicted RNase H-like nuclease (RuvC/YqgF family)